MIFDENVYSMQLAMVELELNGDSPHLLSAMRAVLIEYICALNGWETI